MSTLMLKNYITFTALVVCLTMSLASCGGPQKKSIKPGPSISGLNLSGSWYSPEFGDMKLVQDGRMVRGTYEHRRGPDHNGRLRGRIIGDIINLDWVQPGNIDAAIMPVKGKAWFRISRSGRKLTGRYGYDQSNDDGGVWTAEKSNYN